MSPGDALPHGPRPSTTIRTLAEDLERYDRLSVPAVESWLAAQPPRDLSVVSLGREPLEVSRAISA